MPEDVAVIGFDDVPLASRTAPALTTVRQPMHELGRAAARSLLDRLSGDESGEPSVVIPTELVVRGSTVP